jgi:hypothetical protein
MKVQNRPPNPPLINPAPSDLIIDQVSVDAALPDRKVGIHEDEFPSGHIDRHKAQRR